MLRSTLAAAALVLSSNLSAQITTYVVPPRAQTSLQMVAAADSAQRDSIARATMTTMKAWVDSAAGVAVPADVGDSVPESDSVRTVTTTFAEGSVAPATASNLPTLSVLGFLAVAIGTWLLSQRRRG